MKLAVFLFATLLLCGVEVKGWNPFFNQWLCIGTVKDVTRQLSTGKPYLYRVGELPMIMWRSNADGYVSTVNICNHMGSTLEQGTICKDGTMRCQYHGMEVAKNDYVGRVMQHEDKLFWSYEPTEVLPPSVPYYREDGFDALTFEYEMPCSLPDAAYNSMDLHHPEFVHNRLFGFGSSVPPTNIGMRVYPEEERAIGLSFDYCSSGVTNIGTKKKWTKNYHYFKYPAFTWSEVSFLAEEQENKLIIAVNFLPVGMKTTKWFVSVAQNYLKGPWRDSMVMAMAMSILNQDREQMMKQAMENSLKQEMMFVRSFTDEDVLLRMQPWFEKDYRYPCMEDCREILADFRKKRRNFG